MMNLRGPLAFGLLRKRGRGCGVPCSLQRPFLELESPLAGAPVSRTVVDSDADFPCFSVEHAGRLSPAQGKEGAVRVEHDQVTLEVAHEIELHLREFRVVRGKILDAVTLLCSRAVELQYVEIRSRHTYG